MYTASQVATIFKTARETIRNWAIEFRDELEPSANPGEGRQRAFSERDLEVIALVSEMKGQGKLYADIHAALANGQRGIVPDAANSIIPAEIPKPTQLQARVNLLESELQSRQNEIIRLEALLERSDEQLTDARKEIRALYEEIGLLKATRSTDNTSKE